jgi:endonuclease/exonuclease/phosphatase family metal-dependent hydrolase
MWRDTLLVVSFNVENSQEVDSALKVLTTEPDLRGADIVLLQEVDENGARRMASALTMGFVYYPAILRKATGLNFGNAVLSRWPLKDDEKLILPHRAIFGRTQRIATSVTVQVGSTPIRVYSVHLATPVNLALRDRQDQIRAVLRDAARYPHVIIGGDLNSGSLGSLAEERGFAWPTRKGPRTVFFGRWDHIFFKGLLPPDPGGSGTVLDNRGASDHLPVWARGVVY